MGSASVALIAIVLAWLSTPEQRTHEAAMDQIERQVQLPKGAGSLNDYARLYAGMGDGNVIAVYMLPSLIEREAGQECKELTSLETSKIVPCVSREVRGIKAGERRWISNQGDLPFENAPGCQVITLAFDAGRGQVDEVSCVGDRPVDY